MGIIPDPTDGVPGGHPLPMEFFAQARELSPLERIEQNLKRAEQGAKTKATNEWFDAFVDRSVANELREISKRELIANEAIIADGFEEAFAPELKAHRAKTQPNPILAELYRGDIARAKRWCDSMAVPFPMSGILVATFLFETADGLNETIAPDVIDRVKRMRRALEWGHQTNGCHYDPVPVAMMLEFLEQKVVTKEKTDAK